MAKRITEFSESVLIDLPADKVFERISDLPGLFEKLRRQASFDVQQVTGAGAPANGDTWQISGETRLGQRSGTVAIAEISAPKLIVFRSEARGFAVDTSVTLTSLSPAQCRLEAASELFALTFAARLLAPGIRLWRRRIQKGLGKGLKRLKKWLEA